MTALLTIAMLETLGDPLLKELSAIAEAEHCTVADLAGMVDVRAWCAGRRYRAVTHDELVAALRRLVVAYEAAA